MLLAISDTFTDSLAKLTGDEQRAAKTTAFDLQVDPSGTSMSFHKLYKARDKRFWSVRVSSDLRLIVHRSDTSLLLCYVDHHDDAYKWAERRKLESHPTTGAAQFVEVCERTEEVFVPVYIDVEQPAPPKPRLFAHLADAVILDYGVPPEWLERIRSVTEETILDTVAHLPSEAAEALLQLATGSAPTRTPQPVAAPSDPFDHPDARRRFRVVNNVEELAAALDYPWEKWTVFLHPAQRDSVERTYGGPARVSGSAGTGKTIVALHRAAFLARSSPDARILLTTFSDALANALSNKLHTLLASEPRVAERIEVRSLDAVADRLHRLILGKAQHTAPDTLADVVQAAAAATPACTFGANFVVSEWTEVVDAWQLSTWDAYRTIPRLGRRSRLTERHREALWAVFEKVRAELASRGLVTRSGIYGTLAAHFASKPPPYDAVVVDEAQDVGVAQLRFLAALAAGRPNALFLAGDLGQRIFQKPFSWKALGVDVRGRSRTLRVNYRTSHQIRSQADRLLGPEISDMDGNCEERRGTVSVFNGPPPTVQVVGSPDDETNVVAVWLSELCNAGVKPDEVGVFVRSTTELPRAKAAVELAGLPYTILDDDMEPAPGSATLSTMHLAKGLEFKAVVVMACDDDVLPLQSRIADAADDSDLEEVYNTERQLLYVACTRARDHLLVIGVAPISEFVEDMRL
jgi:hypothetical protein